MRYDSTMSIINDTTIVNDLRTNVELETLDANDRIDVKIFEDFLY